MSLRKTTTDAGTPNRCTTTPRSDGCRSSSSTPSTLLDILGGEMRQPTDQSKTQSSRAPASQCANTTTTSFQQPNSPKSTVAAVSALSARCASANKVPANIASSTAACCHPSSYNPPLPPPPPLERTTTPHYSVSKKRRRDHMDASTDTNCKKMKKHKRKSRKRKRNSYKQFMANALRPKCTHEEKMKIYMKTIKKSLGRGRVPKVERL